MLPWSLDEVLLLGCWIIIVGTSVMDGWKEGGWIDGWMDGWMDVWMDGWMDGNWVMILGGGKDG